MKKASIVALCLSFIVLCTACGKNPIPEDVQIYADKHGVKCYSSEQAAKECKVGESCVVYGTVTYALFTDWFEGSSVLDEMLEGKEGIAKTLIEAGIAGTMRYSIELDYCSDCKIQYKGYNFEKKLNIGKGDKAAFLVSCADDDIISDYEYTIQDVVLIERLSDITVEEEFYAEEGVAYKK